MIRRIPSATLHTVTVTDVRAVLPFLLGRLKADGRDAVPVLIGRHREPMAVLISLEQFHEYCSLVCAQLSEAGAQETGDREARGRRPGVPARDTRIGG